MKSPQDTELGSLVLALPLSLLHDNQWLTSTNAFLTANGMGEVVGDVGPAESTTSTSEGSDKIQMRKWM